MLDFPYREEGKWEIYLWLKGELMYVFFKMWKFVDVFACQVMPRLKSHRCKRHFTFISVMLFSAVFVKILKKKMSNQEAWIRLPPGNKS